jgi:hypothetical protein
MSDKVRKALAKRAEIRTLSQTAARPEKAKGDDKPKADEKPKADDKT